MKNDTPLALTPEQVHLVEKNHNLIYSFMHKHNLPEDMYSVVGIGLCKAAASFDEGKGAAFSSFAYVCMYNECRRAWRYESKQNALNPVSLDDPIPGTEELRIEDLVSDRDLTEAVETSDFLAWFIEDAGTKDLLILLRLLQRCTQVEIAEEMGWTRAMVGARLKRIREAYQKGTRLSSWVKKKDPERDAFLKKEILCTLRLAET